MIDYLFAFPDAATAAAALPGFRKWGDWDGSCVLPVQIGVGYRDGLADPDTGKPVPMPVYAAGYWLVVTTAEPDDALWAIPACMREADREAALRVEAYVLRDRFSAEQLASPWWITPQWAGVDYANRPTAPA